MGVLEKVERAVEPALAAAGVELVDLEVRSGQVRLTVDREGGVDLETIGSVTHAVSRALDEEDAVPGGRYELEVSSPGLERRLRRPEHFEKFVGARVAVRTKAGIVGDRRLEGTLAAADGKGIRVEDESLPDGSRTLSYDDLERVHTVFDWRAALSSGGPATGHNGWNDTRKQAKVPTNGHDAASSTDAPDRDETETR